MADMDAALDRYQEVETGEAFSLQGPRLLKVELSETSVMARNGSMVAYGLNPRRPADGRCRMPTGSSPDRGR